MDAEKTYTELLRRHRPLVWTLCWSYARGDYERCRDLVQEVSLSLWEHYGRLRPAATPLEQRAWVLWHTRTVLNHLHRRNTLRTVPLNDSLADTLTEEQQNPAETLDEIMAALGSDDRKLVQLRLEGYNGQEIAERTGLSRDAVYQRLHRIIERLRKEEDG